jgi:hypothetical protein
MFRKVFPSETCRVLFHNKINLRYCESCWFYCGNTLRCCTVLRRQKEKHQRVLKLGKTGNEQSAAHWYGHRSFLKKFGRRRVLFRLSLQGRLLSAFGNRSTVVWGLASDFSNYRLTNYLRSNIG